MAKHTNPGNQWYGLNRWKKRRRAQLIKHPLCVICLQSRSLVVPAVCVDHVEPHQGDRHKFEFGELQSLCASCHDSIKRVIEQRGYSNEIGRDGWPVDKSHPCWQTK